MQIKAVLFDLDDTLYGEFPICDREGFLAVGRYAERELGIPCDQFVTALQTGKKALHDRLYGEPESHDRVLYAKTTLEMLGINPIRHAEKMHKAYWDAVFRNMKLREGVHELFDVLRARGVQVGICTNMLADIQMQKLCLLGLDERVDFLVTSEEAGADKPKPAIFELALVRAGCTAEEALMVGDTFKHDILGAHHAGIEGIWLHIGSDRAVEKPGLRYSEARSFPEAARLILARVDRKSDTI